MKRALSVLVLLAAPLAAHDYPVTLGTLTLLPGGVRLHLRLSLHHIQPALERFAQRRLAVQDGEPFDAKLLQAYFKGRLELLDARGHALPFTVVKQDADAEELQLTLEALVPKRKGLKLRDALFFEENPKQANLVTVEGAGERRGLSFDIQHPVLGLLP